MTFARITTFILVFTGLTGVASAQTAPDIGLNAGALISIQPVDDWFGGPPYLDEGIGGWTPGVSVGTSIIMPNGFVLLGELTATKAFEKLQQGRLIDTRRTAFGSGTSETRYRDTVVSVLGGYRVRRAANLVIAGGISFVKTAISEDGTALDQLVGDSADHRTIALTGGADYYRPLADNVSVLVAGRYIFADRSSGAEDLGIGPHMVRVTIGLRIRMN